MKVLFVGNSYTYYHEMPTAIFKSMAESLGEEISVTAITSGGYTLASFCKPSDPHGAQLAEALCGTTRYDCVILQEQSLRPAFKNPSSFFDAVRDLTARIRRIGAEPILYATWGRKTGCSTLDTYRWTNESMTWKLAASYQAIGEELKIRVAHVGLAFHDVYTNHPEIDLYREDFSHPSYAGSFLAAATLIATIFCRTPAAYRGALTGESAAILTAAAQKAAKNEPSIPDSYRISSVGVTKEA